MCWKQEWASAINNMTRAMVRIDRAKKKLEARATERCSTIVRARKKGRDDIVKVAEEKLDKTMRGIATCDLVLDSIKEDRYTVMQMINEYGIAQSENPAKTLELMGNCVLCMTEEEVAASPCNQHPYCKVTVTEIPDCCSTGGGD